MEMMCINLLYECEVMDRLDSGVHTYHYIAKGHAETNLIFSNFDRCL